MGCKAETRLPLAFTFDILLRDDRHNNGISAAAVRDDAKRRRTAVGGSGNIDRAASHMKNQAKGGNRRRIAFPNPPATQGACLAGRVGRLA